jgi:hypothetical protein
MMAKNYNWMLDEAASACRENLDVNHVSRYDIKEDAHAIEELSLVKKLGLNEQSEVVDIGAGTGPFVRTLRTVGLAPISKSTSGTNIRPSPGCSSLCWSAANSRSRMLVLARRHLCQIYRSRSLTAKPARRQQSTMNAAQEQILGIVSRALNVAGPSSLF